MIRLKTGVRIQGVQAPLLLGLFLAEQVYASIGVECVVTSLNDGKHCDASQGRPCPDGRPRSLHADGLAADLRIKDVHPTKRELVVVRLTDVLGPEWDVKWEYKGTDNEHVHLEFDPKAVMT